MGITPPPLNPNATPAERAAYRAHLVSVLGYDPALGRPDWARRKETTYWVSVLVVLIAGAAAVAVGLGAIQ